MRSTAPPLRKLLHAPRTSEKSRSPEFLGLWSAWNRTWPMLDMFQLASLSTLKPCEFGECDLEGAKNAKNPSVTAGVNPGHRRFVLGGSWGNIGTSVLRTSVTNFVKPEVIFVVSRQPWWTKLSAAPLCTIGVPLRSRCPSTVPLLEKLREALGLGQCWHGFLWRLPPLCGLFHVDGSPA